MEWKKYACEKKQIFQNELIFFKPQDALTFWE